MAFTEQEKKIGTYVLLIVGGILAFNLLTKKPDAQASNGSGSGSVDDPTGNVGNTNTEVFSASKKAAELLNAMDRFGTDEAAIFKTLNGVTQAQFGLIRQAFGLKQYNGVSQGIPGDIFGLIPSIPLERWLEEELSSTSYATLKIRFPNYL